MSDKQRHKVKRTRNRRQRTGDVPLGDRIRKFRTQHGLSQEQLAQRTYTYETNLTMPDGTVRCPDFTVARPGRPTVYWEHLGMLDRPDYRAGWTAKRAWYISHGILPWEDGGGSKGVLVCSTENQSGSGIDAQEIEQLARRVFDIEHQT